VSGQLKRPGTFEAGMGKLTLRELIFDEKYGQGMLPGRKLRAVVPGGSKCSPCREGTGWMLRLLTKIEEGKGELRDLDQLLKVADSIAGKTVCPFGDAAIAPPQSTVAKFREEYEYHIREKGCWRRVAKTFEEAKALSGQQVSAR
jgi:NADH:ubiquinone oxidoreductase subunit F (NADH-binding)